MSAQTIIIADDHPLVRSALREALRRRMPEAEISECENFADLSRLLHELDGDVCMLLLDLDMPGMHGFVGLLTVQAEWPAVATVMVSATCDGETIEKARACGASGFIPKSAPLEIIVTALGKIIAGDLWFPVTGGASDAAAARTASRLASLTAQQMRVLQMIVEGKLNKQIAGTLDIAEQTVKGHVSAILPKLGVQSRTQIVLSVAPLLGRAPTREH